MNEGVMQSHFQMVRKLFGPGSRPQTGDLIEEISLFFANCVGKCLFNSCLQECAFKRTHLHCILVFYYTSASSWKVKFTLIRFWPHPLILLGNKRIVVPGSQSSVEVKVNEPLRIIVSLAFSYWKTLLQFRADPIPVQY